MLVPYSSNVAFVLRNFSLFLEIFAKKKIIKTYLHIFHFYFVFSLQTYFSTINITISGGDFHIWSMSLILFCIFTWNKLIL